MRWPQRQPPGRRLHDPTKDAYLQRQAEHQDGKRRRVPNKTDEAAIRDMKRRLTIAMIVQVKIKFQKKKKKKKK